MERKRGRSFSPRSADKFKPFSLAALIPHPPKSSIQIRLPSDKAEGDKVLKGTLKNDPPKPSTAHTSKGHPNPLFKNNFPPFESQNKTTGSSLAHNSKQHLNPLLKSYLPPLESQNKHRTTASSPRENTESRAKKQHHRHHRSHSRNKDHKRDKGYPDRRHGDKKRVKERSRHHRRSKDDREKRRRKYKKHSSKSVSRSRKYESNTEDKKHKHSKRRDLSSSSSEWSSDSSSSTETDSDTETYSQKRHRNEHHHKKSNKKQEPNKFLGTERHENFQNKVNPASDVKTSKRRRRSSSTDDESDVDNSKRREKEEPKRVPESIITSKMFEKFKNSLKANEMNQTSGPRLGRRSESYMLDDYIGINDQEFKRKSPEKKNKGQVASLSPLSSRVQEVSLQVKENNRIHAEAELRKELQCLKEDYNKLLKETEALRKQQKAPVEKFKAPAPRKRQNPLKLATTTRGTAQEKTPNDSGDKAVRRSRRLSSTSTLECSPSPRKNVNVITIDNPTSSRRSIRLLSKEEKDKEAAILKEIENAKIEAEKKVALAKAKIAKSARNFRARKRASSTTCSKLNAQDTNSKSKKTSELKDKPLTTDSVDPPKSNDEDDHQEHPSKLLLEVPLLDQGPPELFPAFTSDIVRPLQNLSIMEQDMPELFPVVKEEDQEQSPQLEQDLPMLFPVTPLPNLEILKPDDDPMELKSPEVAFEETPSKPVPEIITLDMTLEEEELCPNDLTIYVDEFPPFTNVRIEDVEDRDPLIVTETCCRDRLKLLKSTEEIKNPSLAPNPDPSSLQANTQISNSNSSQMEQTNSFPEKTKTVYIPPPQIPKISTTEVSRQKQPKKMKKSLSQTFKTCKPSNKKWKTSKPLKKTTMCPRDTTMFVVDEYLSEVKLVLFQRERPRQRIADLKKKNSCRMSAMHPPQ